MKKYRSKAGKFENKRFRASFTVEATMVLSVVFMTLALMIRYAYMGYDRVTGTMILAETVINARENRDDECSDTYFEEVGKCLGNPRLWMGEYMIEIETNTKGTAGKASTDEWSQEIEIKAFRPDDFLRQVDGLKSLAKSGDEKDENGYRIPERDESELYGNSFGIGME